MKSVGGRAADRSSRSAIGAPVDLADEVMKGDVQRALGAAVVADGRRHRIVGRGQPASRRVELADRPTRSGNTAAIVSTVSP